MAKSDVRRGYSFVFLYMREEQNTKLSYNTNNQLLIFYWFSLDFACVLNFFVQQTFFLQRTIDADLI